MNAPTIAVFAVSLLLQTTTVQGSCKIYSQQQQSTYSIKETAENGTHILNGTNDPADFIELKVKQPSLDNQQLNELSSFFMLQKPDNATFIIFITKPLDLEYFNDEFGSEITFLMLFLKCGADTLPEITVTISPVNEVNPEFNGAPYFIRVREDMPENDLLMDLSLFVTDKDVGDTVNFYYNIFPYAFGNEEHGADKYFILRATTNGRITKNNITMDFDTMPSHMLMLNISVKDATGATARTAFATINITVTDADDQRPTCNHPECIKCTAPPYTATIRDTDKTATTPNISRDNTRPLWDHPEYIKCFAPLYTAKIMDTYKDIFLFVYPKRIKAIDPDPDQTEMKLLYSIDSGNEHELFRINIETAEISMHKSVTEAGYNGDNIRLIIKVSKGENDLVSFNVAVLLVSISGRNSCNADIPPTESVCQITGNLGLLIGLIITGVLLFAVIVCLVIAISLLKKTPKESIQYDVPAPPTDHDNYARIDVNMIHLRNTDELRNTYENEFHTENQRPVSLERL